MNVKTLCLGMLSIRDACGYDLKKLFESSFKHFFPAGYGSIYPALADLADQGLVEFEEIPQVGKPNRKVYKITEDGEAAFREALNRSDPQHKVKSEFLAFMYFSDRIENDRLASILDHRIEELRDSIKIIQQSKKQEGIDTPGSLFVAGFGAFIAEAAAKYIESNRHLLIGSVNSDLQETLNKN